MGMSGDFESAIEMGSDNVRVGSTISERATCTANTKKHRSPALSLDYILSMTLFRPSWPTRSGECSASARTAAGAPKTRVPSIG